MAAPSTNVFEVREDLGMRVDEFDLEMNRRGFIAHRVLPILTRTKPEGKFPKVPLEEMLQNQETTRAADGSYRRSRMEFKDDSYSTDEHGLEALLDDRTIARYDDLIDAEMYEGRRIEHSLLLSYEKEAAALLFNTTTFAGRTASVTTEWSNRGSSTPGADIDARKETIKLAFGKRPNALVISYKVFENLINNDSLINRLKYQGFQDARPGEINAQALAVSLNLAEVVVADSVYNTKQPGVDAVLGDIWDDEYALLCCVARTNDPTEPCLGRTFMWDREGRRDGSAMGVIAETYYESARRGGVLRRRTDWGLKMLFPEAGYLLSNITA